MRHAAVAPPDRSRALRLLRLGSNHSVLSSRAAAAALSSTESVQHRERRTAPDPPRKTPQTAAEALQTASTTSTRPTGKIIHRFPSNTRDNSAEITRECVSIKHTTAAALQALNVIKRDYFQHAHSFVLYTVFMRLSN